MKRATLSLSINNRTEQFRDIDQYNRIKEHARGAIKVKKINKCRRYWRGVNSQILRRGKWREKGSEGIFVGEERDGHRNEVVFEFSKVKYKRKITWILYQEFVNLRCDVVVFDEVPQSVTGQNQEVFGPVQLDVEEFGFGSHARFQTFVTWNNKKKWIFTIRIVGNTTTFNPKTHWATRNWAETVFSCDKYNSASRFHTDIE